MHSLCIRVDILLSAQVHHTHTLSRLAPEHFSATRTLDARTHTAPLAHRTPHSRPQLLPHAVRGATSTRSACMLRVERPRRTAVHFFPHTRPPDTHSHLSPQHHTPPLDRGAAVEYQGPLVNPYCTSDLCRPRGLARPPSASCDRRAFGHSTMSDPADAWFPRPRTLPAPSRKKDATHHGLLRPRASHTHTDATIPGAQLLQATRGATSVRRSCNLRMVRQRSTATPFFPPDDDAWLDIHQRVCTRSRPARPSHRRSSRRPAWPQD